MTGDAMDWYRERLGDALHRVAHPHHPWSGCAYPDLFYDKLTHFMGDLAASGLTVRPALLADTPSVEPKDLDRARAARIVARLPRMLTEADDYAWVPIGDVLLAIMDPDAGEVAYPEGEPRLELRTLIDGAVDVERFIEAVRRSALLGRREPTVMLRMWVKYAEVIQRHYALLPTQASDSPEKTT